MKYGKIYIVLLQRELGIYVDTSKTGAVVHEFSSASSAHDIETFRKWLQAQSEESFIRAEVDRFGGLTLFLDGNKSVLHFSNAVCGFKGTGPQASVTILHEAGFGTRQDLEQLIYHGQKVAFTK